VHSRTVGARIASILRDEALTTPPGAPTEEPSSAKRRRFRVIIHSSPFLRCVQTSIAISAGLAASNPALSSTTTLATPLVSSQATGSSVTLNSYFSGASTATTTSSLSNISAESPMHFEKPVLRVDPFLGEWLSPEYFEHITPPPESALMLATAKAELLRRSSYHDYPHYHAHVHSSATSHLWSGAPNLSDALLSPLHHGPHNSSLEMMSQIAQSLPGHEGNSSKSLDPKITRKPSHGGQHAPGYVFPVPSYALSTIEPIPRGYVAHARDACVAIDYHWDSSRDSLAWGDGGTLPEEWASMHQRFRKGLKQLVDWYGSTKNPGELVTRARASRSCEPDCAIDDDEEEEEEIEHVVVLVSHGAGCNALVGAITQQPVLADVPMSSLTMAKRRVNFGRQSITFSREDFAVFRDAASPKLMPSMPEMYELKLFANTDHLIRPTALAFNRPPASTRPDLLHNRSDSGHTSALKDINLGSLYGAPTANGRTNFTNASLGSIRKPSGGPSLITGVSVSSYNSGGITVGGGVTSFSPTRPDRSGSGTWGLWSPRSQADDPLKEPETPLVFLEVGNGKAAKPKDAERGDEDNNSDSSLHPTHTTNSNKSGENTSAQSSNQKNDAKQEQAQEEHHDEEHDHFDQNAFPRLWAGTGNGGLWGAPRPPGEAERLRDFSAHKRRWTVNER
jgi:hypothetical protein